MQKPEWATWEQVIKGKYSGVASPYSFKIKRQGGWVIRWGRSGFLVAEGPQNTVRIGKELFRSLERDFWKRRKKKRPVK